MVKALLRKLIAFPVILLLINFLGYAYALIGQAVFAAQNPWGSSVDGFPNIFARYGEFAAGMLRGDFGVLPTVSAEPIPTAVMHAAGASLGLLCIAFAFSVPLGLVLGFAAVKNETARVANWLTPFTSMGLALPSFYIGAILVLFVLYQMIGAGADAKPILPLAGFGWDAHLVLPILALIIRPTVQVAQITAEFMAGEMGKQYIVTSRAMGHSWARIRWQHALRNMLAPLTAAVAGTFRGLFADLILVEWLFSWPGIGQLLVHTVVAPSGARPYSMLGGMVVFLNPPLLAALLTAFAAIFLFIDLIATVLGTLVDPRLRSAQQDQEVEYAG
ncbi:MAG TPA: ABC transporter permease [Anaerolineaceae bacterium]|nr:ABC transporter permease [Anaerolineaceae bacterium]